jgi:hypothetical protein
LKQEGIEQTGLEEGAGRGMTSDKPIAEVMVFMEMTKSKIV